MPGPNQKISTVLIPEHGLELSPEFITESIVTPDFSRSFAHLVGKSNDRGILLRATSGGSLYVASAGVPFEAYLVYAGTGANAYAAPNIQNFVVPYQTSDFLIETFPSVISFCNLLGVWLPDKSLPVGMHSIDFIHYGFRIRNRIPGSNSVYEITIYR